MERRQAPAPGREMTNRWRMTHEDDVARIAPARGPSRMDLAVHAAWDAPGADAAPADVLNRRRYRLALAAQVRQDVWRALQSHRGFVPVVEATSDHSGEGGAAPGAARIMIAAGGRIDVPQAPRAEMEAAIRAVLDDPSNRRRWRAHAARRARPRPADALL